MAPSFERLGFTTRIYDNPLPGQGPVLLATRIEDARLPTVLGYGHGDVIRGLEDQWTKGKGPWVTARDGDRALRPRHRRQQGPAHPQHGGPRARCARSAAASSASTSSSSSRRARRRAPRASPSWWPRNKADFAADVLIASDGPRVTPGAADHHTRLPRRHQLRSRLRPARGRPSLRQLGRADRQSGRRSSRTRSPPSSGPPASCWCPRSRRRR